MKNDNLIEHADQSALLNTHITAASLRSEGFGGSGGVASPETVLIAYSGSREIFRADLATIQTSVAACTGIQEPEKAIQGAREALSMLGDLDRMALALQNVLGPVTAAEWRDIARAALKQLGGKL